MVERPMMRRVAVAFLVVLSASAAAFGQDVQTDPLQCWWKTSAGAVRMGEPFSVILTCAVLETDAATVVVDQSRLEPSVVQLAPFEVLGGSHGADLRTGDRRFFQYEYRLRLIADGLSNKEIAQKTNITVGTIRTHLEHIYKKLHVRGRTEAMAKYFRAKQNAATAGDK